MTTITQVEPGERSSRTTKRLLATCLCVLFLDAVIEIAFFADTLKFVDDLRPQDLYTGYDDGHKTTYFYMDALPKHFKTKHIAVGLAAASFTATIALFGLVALQVRSGPDVKNSRRCKIFCYGWLALSIASLILTLSSIGYFMVTVKRDGQRPLDFEAWIPETESIYPDRADIEIPGDNHYPYSAWTPEGWFGLLSSYQSYIDIFDADRHTIAKHVPHMKGGRINLIVLTVVQITTTALSVYYF